MFWLPGSGFNGFDGPEIVKKNIHEANKKNNKTAFSCSTGYLSSHHDVATP